ncbi:MULTISPECIES: GNAT family N-acetyltransferase [Micrococcaceae]|uniref:GNAT family N-acetyltransferase n=1 Tax=unclassified Kocuria TaxID=2649579 RepID=UPI0018D6EEFA|nr:MULTISPECIES: GNAT family N-acetyltransferase [unclassified Kocuria]
MTITVRPATVRDAPGIAQVHVGSWRETYRGLMPDEILDAPDLLNRRLEMWKASLTEARWRERRISVAELEGRIVGGAMVGSPRDNDSSGDAVLYVLYTYNVVHGAGAGAKLLSAVTRLDEETSLWVADPNPRAQAFYTKHGFVADGTRVFDERFHISEIRMIRTPQSVAP